MKLRRPIFEDRLHSAIVRSFRASPYVSPFTSPRCSQGESPLSPRKDTTETTVKTKILLVEDNKLVQQIAIKLLQKLDLIVDVADNGLEAVKMIFENSYFAVFMDCQMPVMDGFEATRQIRKREKKEHLPHTRIIALTAGVSEQMQRECIEAGMDTFIKKPVTLKMMKVALGIDKEGDGKES